MKIILCFCLIITFFSGFGFAETRYVSPSGDDSNPGTYSEPWATPGYGSKAMQSGDTLIIMGGTYTLSVYWDDIITPPSGSSGQYTIIKGQNGKRPVLQGTDDLYSAIELSGKSYIRISNLDITSIVSPGSPGLRVGISGTDSPVSDIIIQGVKIYNVDEFGIDLKDINNMKILNSGIDYCGFGSMGGPSAGSGGGWKNILIDGCSLSFGGHYYQGAFYQGSDVSPYNRPDGFGIEASEGPIEIRNCTAERNLGDGLDSKAKNTHISNCIVKKNNCDGIKLWSGDSSIKNCLIYGIGYDDPDRWPWACSIVIGEYLDDNSSFLIENVTLEDNPFRARHYIMYVDTDSTEISSFNVTMRNSIIANGYAVAFFGDRVNAVIEHNLFFIHDQPEQVYANGQSYTASEINNGNLQTGNISYDPQFIDPYWHGGWGSYRLSDSSPAINAGTDNGPGHDLNYNPRPYGPNYDIGCYEESDHASISINGPAFRGLFLLNCQDPSDSVWNQLLKGVSAKFMLAGDITGNMISEIVVSIDGYGIYYYDRVYKTWNRLLSLPADALTLSRADPGKPVQIIASFSSYGIYRYNMALSSWVKILDYPAVSLCSGNIDSDSENIDELIISFTDYEGLFFYDFRSCSLMQIINETPAQFTAVDIHKDGSDSVIFATEASGLYYCSYSSIYKGFKFKKISNSVPDTGHFLGFGDIEGDEDLELIMANSGKTYYYNFELQSWHLLIQAPFSRIISGSCTGAQKDDLLMLESSSQNLYIRNGSDQAYNIILSGAFSDIMTAL